MKTIWAMTSEPSAFAAARTPVSDVPAHVGAALIPTTATSIVMDQPVARVRMTADAPFSLPLPQVHQVPAQAGVAEAHLGAVENGYRVNGFTVKGFAAGATRRSADAARGVPPRGRPV